MTLELQVKPEPPEFNNSAGRLLSLLKMLGSNSSYVDTIIQFYGEKANVAPHRKGKAYMAFMSLVSRAFDEFIVDVESSAKIPDVTRSIITEGLGDLINCAYPTNTGGAPRKLQDAEVAMLRMAASMLDAEPSLEPSDLESIRTSLDELRHELDNADLKPGARIALLELVRLTRNAVDYYSIHGVRGFRKAFKKMLAELMELYLHEGKDVTAEKWWQTAIKHVRTIDATVARILKYKPLLDGATSLFLGSSDTGS
jgi:hypothetical protein